MFKLRLNEGYFTMEGMKVMQGSRLAVGVDPLLDGICCHVGCDKLAHFKRSGLDMRREGC